jgi:hypothetical protein
LCLRLALASERNEAIPAECHQPLWRSYSTWQTTSSHKGKRHNIKYFFFASDIQLKRVYVIFYSTSNASICRYPWRLIKLYADVELRSFGMQWCVAGWFQTSRRNLLKKQALHSFEKSRTAYAPMHARDRNPQLHRCESLKISIDWFDDCNFLCGYFQLYRKGLKISTGSRNVN